MYNLEIIYEVIEYIESNLKNPLTVKAVADKVGYSLFHFIRMFNSIVKLSPYDYIIRRRLSEAAKDLNNTKKKIIDIAYDYQFKNHETFSRAFYKMFGILPNMAKKNNIDNLILKTKDTFNYLKHINKLDRLIPEIIEVDKIYLVGIASMLPGSQNMLPSLWEDFKLKKKLINNRIIPEKYYFIKLRSMKNNNKYDLQMLGAETTTTEDIPENFVSKTISSNKYLKFSHNGKYSELNFTLDYIYQTWLPKSGCEIKNNYEIECFDSKCENLDGSTLKFDILISLI